MMTLKAKFQVKAVQTLMMVRGIEDNGEVQKFIDSEVLRRNDPYVPLKSGMLKGSGTRSTKIGSGEVVYQTPYARRMYYGDNYKFSGAPMRGARWFERMKADHRDSILRGAAKVAGGRSG